jgi:hypothetical protein
LPKVEDPPGLFARWVALLVKYQCKDKVAHDARDVAAMNHHGLTHVLTFNTADFARFPGIVAVDPATIMAAAASTPGSASSLPAVSPERRRPV